MPTFARLPALLEKAQLHARVGAQTEILLHKHIKYSADFFLESSCIYSYHGTNYAFMVPT